MNNKARIITIVGIGIIMLTFGLLFLMGMHTNQSQTSTNNTTGNGSSAPTSVIQTQGGNTITQSQEQSPTIHPSTVPIVTVPTNDNARALELNHQLQTEPDLYLSNYLPYETADFAASADFTTTPVNHFYFTVLVKNNNTSVAMQKFQQWLLSLGLTQQQITQLDIRYQTQ